MSDHTLAWFARDRGLVDGEVSEFTRLIETNFDNLPDEFHQFCKDEFGVDNIGRCFMASWLCKWIIHKRV